MCFFLLDTHTVNVTGSLADTMEGTAGRFASFRDSSPRPRLLTLAPQLTARVSLCLPVPLCASLCLCVCVCLSACVGVLRFAPPKYSPHSLFFFFFFFLPFAFCLLPLPFAFCRHGTQADLIVKTFQTEEYASESHSISRPPRLPSQAPLSQPLSLTCTALA